MARHYVDLSRLMAFMEEVRSDPRQIGQVDV
jgi:hypothetical protein